MGFRVPLAIVNKAHQANQLYPFAISLIESGRTYEAINEKVTQKKDVSLLVAGMKKEIQNLISEVDKPYLFTRLILSQYIPGGRLGRDACLGVV